MQSLTLHSLSLQAPDSGRQPSSILHPPSSPFPGDPQPAEAGTPNGASALDVAAERLDLLAAESAEDARLFMCCNLAADAARCRLEGDALRLAAGTLREFTHTEAALAPANVVPWHRHSAPVPASFAPAGAVLLACADDLAMKALDALEAGFIRHPLEAAGYQAEASALRYAVAVLANETPATPEQLAA